METTIYSSDKHHFTWVDIVNPSAEDMQTIAEKYNLNKEVVIDCMDPQHLPKYEESDDFIFIITRIFDRESDTRANNVFKLTRKIALFCTEKVILTIHRAQVDFLEKIAAKLHLYENKKNFSRFFVLALIIDEALLSYSPLAENYAYQLEEYEEQLFLSKTLPNLTTNFYYVKRQASIIKKVIMLSKDIINKLEKHTNGAILQDLKDTYTDVETHFEGIIENSGYLLNTYLSITAQRTNEIMRILTILSVFFLPLTFIVGVYGMNFEYIPELSMPYGYFTVWVLMVIVCIGIYIYFRRKKWID